MAGFVKAMRSEEADFLDKHPIANHVLNVIARRARRTKCTMTGLEVGECFIGHKGLGITEQQYRTAKKNLTKWNLVEFKRGRRATDVGTVAKLLNSKVYDINEIEPNGRTTEEQRKPNGSLTTNKECKKEIKEEVVTDVPAEPKPKWDFELCRAIWNEVKESQDCPATGCNIVPKELKSGLPKVHKEYIAYCHREGKNELERHEWFRAYCKGHLKRCEGFVGRNGEHSNWKPSIKDLGKMKTFEQLINRD